MAAPRAKRAEFAYPKALFYQRVALFLVVEALVLFFLFVVAPRDERTASFVTTVGLATTAFVALYAVTSGLMSILTTHWVTTTRIILRQGWFFKAVIPLQNVETVERTDEIPRWFRTQGTLYVVSSSQKLVAIQLKERIRFPAALGRRPRRVVVSLLDPDGFVAAVRERLAELR